MTDSSLFEIFKLTTTTSLFPFHCTDEDLNEFLYHDAIKYFEEMMAVTYVIIDKKQQKTAAYFSLLNDKIAYDPLSKGIWNKINRHVHNNKRRRSYPSVKLGRLAVHNEYMRLGLGSNILSFIKHLYATDNRAGCRFLTVDAYSDATKFYEKNGFDYFTSTDIFDKTRLMFFDLKSIKNLI